LDSGLATDERLDVLCELTAAVVVCSCVEESIEFEADVVARLVVDAAPQPTALVGIALVVVAELGDSPVTEELPVLFDCRLGKLIGSGAESLLLALPLPAPLDKSVDFGPPPLATFVVTPIE
jgi:hypothetical protein